MAKEGHLFFGNDSLCPSRNLLWYRIYFGISSSTIILNILFRQLPVIIQSASSSLAQMSEKVEMAARDLGATKIEVLKDVVWPSLKSTYITGFV